MPTALETLRQRLADVNALRSATAIMEWDMQTYMPAGGVTARAEHLGTLSRMAHDTLVADETQAALFKAKDEAEGDDIDLVRVVQRDIDLATKIPSALVEEKLKQSALAHEVWAKARAENDFAAFAPYLEKMFEIARQEAEYLGYTDHIYDALIDQYEEGATMADARAMFDAIRGPQIELVREIASQPKPDDAFLYGEWDTEAQSKFTQMITKAIGFDYHRGRQDTAAHPFCTGWSIGDIRLTTRYKPYIGSAIFGSLHEAGHGMYEQGSPAKWDLTPLAGGVSMGVHESQSRLWENIVGRSRPFWKRFLPDLKSAFPALGDVEIDHFYRAINVVEPSFIRVEADVLTYNLHVLIRFELECDLVTGTLAVKDLPEAWNSKYEEYLGIRPSTDSIGCLQDVHWSGGMVGYFPTYSMGNLLSYQIWGTLQRDLGDTDALIEAGEFAPILTWLQEKVYQKGRSMPPKDLVLTVTGKPLDPSDYLAGLNAKYRHLYGI